MSPAGGRMEEQLDTDWQAVARKLARWLPMSRTVFESVMSRPDVPLDMVSESMTPEDWMRAAQEALRRHRADLDQP